MREHVIEDRTIEACQGGDAEAFRVLFENYKDRVYSIALGYFNGDEASARDITQTVFLKLMTHISTFQNRSEFSTWLYRMVANACLDQKRALRRFLSFGRSEEIVLPDQRKSAEERYIARELEAEVRKSYRRPSSQTSNRRPPEVLRRSFLRRNRRGARLQRRNRSLATESRSSNPGAEARASARRRMTMLGNHGTQHLSAYLHGELSAELNSRVENHLRECDRCRASYDEIRFAARMASLLTTSAAPESIWHELQKRNSRSGFRIPQIATAVAALVVVAAVSWLLANRIPHNKPNIADSWAVESLRGAPRIQNTAISGSAELRTGETLQTDGSSQAEVRIASIGKLTIDPNTRIRLVITKADEHRIALDHGKVEAITWAPPRLFVVDTPSARAVDLGCMYTLEVQEDGSSLLHVTLGMVSLASHGRESFVPAYDYAHSRRGFGPGTPFHEESSERFKAALDAIDFEAGGPVDVVLAEAKKRDATTLWHLLSRIAAGDRGKVYDKLASFVAPPASVTRNGIIGLDANMLRALGESIPELWWMTREAQSPR